MSRKCPSNHSWVALLYGPNYSDMFAGWKYFLRGIRPNGFTVTPQAEMNLKMNLRRIFHSSAPELLRKRKADRTWQAPGAKNIEVIQDCRWEKNEKMAKWLERWQICLSSTSHGRMVRETQVERWRDYVWIAEMWSGAPWQWCDEGGSHISCSAQSVLVPLCKAVGFQL